MLFSPEGHETSYDNPSWIRVSVLNKLHSKMGDSMIVQLGGGKIRRDYNPPSQCAGMPLPTIY